MAGFGSGIGGGVSTAALTSLFATLAQWVVRRLALADLLDQRRGLLDLGRSLVQPAVTSCDGPHPR